MTDLRVVDADTGETLPGIPTMFLADNGGGVAYGVDLGRNTVWYAADYPGFEAPENGDKRTVRIVHTDDYRVDVHVRVIDASADEQDEDTLDAMEWDDYFIVEAATKFEAEELARNKAIEEAEKQWGGNPEGFYIEILRSRKGVSI